MGRINRKLSNAASRSAFTLIELLVVAAILTVLMAILLPATRRATAAARVAVCLSNQRQITIAALSYAGDNFRVLPYASTYGWEYQMQANSYVRAFEAYATSKVYYCPSRGPGPWGGWGGMSPQELWDWPTYGTPRYANAQIQHLVDYWLYFMSGRDVSFRVMVAPQRLTAIAQPGKALAISCWGPGYGITSVFAGKYYAGFHEGLPAAMISGSAELIPPRDLIYDGRAGRAQILTAVRRPYVSQAASPHPLSFPVVQP